MKLNEICTEFGISFETFADSFWDRLEATQTDLFELLNKIYPKSPYNDGIDLFSDYFYGHGERNITIFTEYQVVKCINSKGGYLDFADHMLTMMYGRYYPKWKKQYEALALEYNITSPYDMDITETEDNTLDSSTKIGQISSGSYTDSDKLNSHNTDNTDSIYAFNSTEDSTPTDRSVVSEDSSRSGSGSNSGSKNIDTDYGSKRGIKRTVKRLGNIGNTTKQQLIEFEIKLRDILVYKIIFKDLNEMFTRSVYN